MTPAVSSDGADKPLSLLRFSSYLGDLKNEQSVLEWLVDDDNRELDDQIEAVNYKMLEKLMETSPFLAVFFCKWIMLRA